MLQVMQETNGDKSSVFVVVLIEGRVCLRSLSFRFPHEHHSFLYLPSPPATTSHPTTTVAPNAIGIPCCTISPRSPNALILTRSPSGTPSKIVAAQLATTRIGIGIDGVDILRKSTTNSVSSQFSRCISQLSRTVLKDYEDVVRLKVRNTFTPTVLLPHFYSVEAESRVAVVGVAKRGAVVVAKRCGGGCEVVRWSFRCSGGCAAVVVVLSQKSKFDNGLRYLGGEIHVMKGIDPDRWSYFEAIGIVTEFKYDADFKLWWKGSKQTQMNSIRLLSNDMEALYLARYAEETKEEIDMYVQHVTSEAVLVHFLPSGEVAEQECDGGHEEQDVEVGEEECDGGHEQEKDEMGVEYDGGDEQEKDEMVEEDQDVEMGDEQQDVEMGEEECDDGEETAEYDVGDQQDSVIEEDEGRNVVEGFVEASNDECLDDSEEDRMANDDDGFGVDNARVEEVVRDINPVLERWTTMKKKKKRVTKRGKVGEGSFIINEEVHVDDMNEEYSSDELDSNVDSDGDERVKKAKFKKFRQDDMSKNFKFELGMEFCTLREFKNAVMEHSVLNGKEVKFVKNDGTRARAICKNKCGFVIMASKVGGKQTFCVKTLVGEHNCGRVFGNKSANVNWIAQVLTDRFVNVANMSVNQIIDDIKKSFSVGITAWKAGKAKQIALDSLVGDGERQYGRLYDYVGELLRVKCGTFKIKVNQPQPSLPPRFGSFYMCLEGCKQGFLGSCRPFIGVDGCHLKTTYGGQLLVAVGRDPNDQYFPLAFAVVETECKETWRWFLTLLLDDIGGIDCQRWIFISDQQKGLMAVFDEILEGVEHRLCVRHLYNNYKKKFGGGVIIRDLMMAAAKATYQQDWERKMGELKNVNIDAYNWLLAIPTKCWCKHAFSCYPRCDVLINNLSESFNSTILLARDKPIITMMEWIRTYIMRRFATLREKATTYTGVVMPKPRKRLDREVEKSGNWIPTWAGAAKFEVTHGFTMDKFVVDLSNHSCSCYFWDLVGIPCRHAVAAINYKLENPEDYVHPYYKKEAYVTCYEPEIVPINGQQLWKTSEAQSLLPPIYKTPPGRPKKLRRRDADEYVSHVKLSKKNVLMKCSSCNAFGHNVRSCKRAKRKNTRGTSSVGGSGSSRPTTTAGGSEAQPVPSMSQGGGTRLTSHSGRPSSTHQSGTGPSSTHQSGRRTSSRLMASQDLGSQASTS
ncbi:hypothetical protein V8G54_036550 [Vigna mungo]|uniref:SWIM-type domain-containing protein n=2 Tax=Vigna mungo TaxID=3915 RepID=A0AAQ3MGZ3_VIGMU